MNRRIWIWIIAGACLIGVGFQHFVRGPKMRLDRIESALHSKDWAAFGECFSESDLKRNGWSRELLHTFFKEYGEPEIRSQTRVIRRHETFFGQRLTTVALQVKRDRWYDLCSASQENVGFQLFHFRKFSLFVPLGKRELAPSPVRFIRDIASVKYPQASQFKNSIEERLSEYEFLLAERKKLDRLGIVRRLPARGQTNAMAFEAYLLNSESLFVRLKIQYKHIAAKYGRTFPPPIPSVP